MRFGSFSGFALKVVRHGAMECTAPCSSMICPFTMKMLCVFRTSTSSVVQNNLVQAAVIRSFCSRVSSSPENRRFLVSQVGRCTVNLTKSVRGLLIVSCGTVGLTRRSPWVACKSFAYEATAAVPASTGGNGSGDLVHPIKLVTITAAIAQGQCPTEFRIAVHSARI